MNQELLAGLPDADQINFALAMKGLRYYLENITVNSLPCPRPFSEVARPWQWEKIFSPLIPAIESTAGVREEYHGPHRFWYTLPRGHDKTSAIARVCSYALVFARRRLKISAAAKDRDQAKLLRDAILMEKDLNPWYGKFIDVQQYVVLGPAGKLEILAADAGGAYGAGDDIIVIDELTHWTSNALYVAMTSGKFKRSSSEEGGASNVFFIITNAGYEGTWQYDLRNLAMEEMAKGGDWHVFEADGFLADWMSRKAVEETRAEIIQATGSVYEAARLIDNVWIPTSIGAAFSPELVRGMEVESDVSGWEEIAA